MSLVQWLIGFGYIGVFAAVFAESGLFFGFFLPGDSLLFTAGFLSSQGVFNIVALCLLSFIGAAAGDNVGYTFGRRVGPKIFNREKSLFFDPEHLQRAHRFFEKHGGKSLVLARFMPGVRTFTPIAAGVGKMAYRKFVFYNLLGALLWGVCVPLTGYFLGRIIPGVDKYLLPIVVGIIIVSVMPTAIHLLKNPAHRQRIVQLLSFKK